MMAKSSLLAIIAASCFARALGQFPLPPPATLYPTPPVIAKAHPLAYGIAPPLHATALAPIPMPAYKAAVLPPPHPVAYGIPPPPGNPNYDFHYEINDLASGDAKTQHEVRTGDAVEGHYSMMEADGTMRTVHYHADPTSGFQAQVTKSAGGVPGPVPPPDPVMKAAIPMPLPMPMAPIPHPAPAPYFAKAAIPHFAATGVYAPKPVMTAYAAPYPYPPKPIMDPYLYAPKPIMAPYAYDPKAAITPYTYAPKPVMAGPAYVAPPHPHPYFTPKAMPMTYAPTPVAPVTYPYGPKPMMTPYAAPHTFMGAMTHPDPFVPYAHKFF